MIDVKVDTLLKAAEKKSFTRTAEDLSLTQPAVSHHIALLEKELGSRLFIRSKNKVILTNEGEIAVKYARRMKALYEKMRMELLDCECHITKLRIGVTHTSESNVVSEVLARYSHENRGVVITLITDTIKNLYAMLDNYELDLAVVEGRQQNARLNTLLLNTDYMVCIVPPGHPLAHKTMVTLDDIKKEKLILRLPKSETRNLFFLHLMNINETIDHFNVILEVDNIATIKDLVHKNLGISILPRSACIDDLHNGYIAALPIENLSIIRETNIVYQKDFNHPEVLEDLVRIYKKTAPKG